MKKIESKGDAALLGGVRMHDVQVGLDVPHSRPLADFLPSIVLKARDFANEITCTQVKQMGVHSEAAIAREHVRNNLDVRKLLMDRGIVPETLVRAGIAGF